MNGPLGNYEFDICMLASVPHGSSSLNDMVVTTGVAEPSEAVIVAEYSPGGHVTMSYV